MIDPEKKRKRKREWHYTEAGQAFIKRYRAKNAAKISSYLKEWRDSNRLKVLTFYSNGKLICSKCGYADHRALCLDHIENNGAEHRRSLSKGNKRSSGSNSVYLDLIKTKFPPGFQVLCHNCNFIKEQDRLASIRKAKYEN